MTGLYADEADEEWLADRREHRLSVIRRQRPARLSVRGDLDATVSEWGARLLQGTAGNLLLGGPTGSGKTWQAWEVLERAVAAGYPGRIVFATTALWQETIAPPVDREQLQLMRDADLLVFDDLGSGRVNEWQRECLLTVVDERWAHARPIIITFNVESLREMLGERLASRLADGATKAAIKGADRRRSQ